MTVSHWLSNTDKYVDNLHLIGHLAIDRFPNSISYDIIDQTESHSGKAEKYHGESDISLS